MKLLEFRRPLLMYFEKLLPTKINTNFTNPVSLRKSICPKNPNAVTFFSSPTNALMCWAKSIDLKTNDIVGVVAPYPPEFYQIIKKTGATLRLLPSDPDELIKINFNSFKAVLFSNPNLANSFYYPEELYSLIFKHLLQFPNLHVLSEESLHEFFRHVEMPEPGSARNFQNNQLTILSGTYSFSSGLLSWLIQDHVKIAEQEVLLKSVPENAYSIFTSNEVRNLKEFSKRLFVMEFNLKRFLSDLRPAINAKIIRISHWPQPRALYLMIDIEPILMIEKISVEKWIEKLAFNTGILVDSGSHMGEKTSIRVCLGYGYKHLRKVSEILCQYFCHSIEQK